MSVLRPLLSRRGRLVFVATALLLIGALVAAPSVGGARPASVKQFTASISGGDAGSLTMTVTNCGGTPLVLPCTASSTIALGSVRISFGTGSAFAPDSPPTVTSPDGRNWTASYNSTTGNLDAQAVSNDKLQPGETVLINWHIAASATTCVTQVFSIGAWGSAAISGSDPFALVGPPPTLNCVGSGEPVTDPVTGQTDTVTGTFTGHVFITFGGEGPDCGGPDFGALGDQWQVYHQATPSHLTPAGDFGAGGPKLWTTEFPLSTAPGGPDADSSWYLTCYAVPQDGHTRFASRGTVDGLAVGQTVGGVLSWVGILPSCGIRPCVSEQFLTTGPGAPPWSPTDNMVHIGITVDPGDPHRD
jgi:hypothetical protein